MLDLAVAAILKASAEVVAVVAGRISPVSGVQGDRRPFLTYQLISGESIDTFDCATEWTRHTVQVDVYADDYKTATTLATKVRNALHYQRGTVGDVYIGASLWQNTSDLTSAVEPGESQPVYRMSLDFSLLWREA